jgi:hypothetical protein
VAHALLVVAARAREGEVLGRVRAAVRLREHVLDGRRRLALARDDELRAAVDALADEAADARVLGEGLVRRDDGEDEGGARGHGAIVRPRRQLFQGEARERGLACETRRALAFPRARGRDSR